MVTYKKHKILLSIFLGVAVALVGYTNCSEKSFSVSNETVQRLLSENSSIYINGVDPGFITDLIPLAFASTCASIEQVRCMEIADYATYDGATVMFDVMGFGQPLDEVPMLFQPGVLSVAWGCAIRQLAAGLNITLDSITESYEREPAPEAFDIAAGHIPKGGVAAVPGPFRMRGSWMHRGCARQGRRAGRPVGLPAAGCRCPAM